MKNTKWIDFKDKLPKEFGAILVKICHKETKVVKIFHKICHKETKAKSPLFFAGFTDEKNKLFLETDFYPNVFNPKTFPLTPENIINKRTCFTVCPNDYSDLNFYWKRMQQVLDEEKHENDAIEKDTDRTFSVGDIIWIERKDQHYLLAAVGYCAIIPVCINTPGRGQGFGSINIVENAHAITLDELNQSIGDDFGLIELKKGVDYIEKEPETLKEETFCLGDIVWVGEKENHAHYIIASSPNCPVPTIQLTRLDDNEGASAGCYVEWIWGCTVRVSSYYDITRAELAEIADGNFGKVGRYEDLLKED